MKTTFEDASGEQFETIRQARAAALAKIEIYSALHKKDVLISPVLYHASLYSGITRFDPARGQGLGVWAATDLAETAHFAMSRSRDPKNGQCYAGAVPTIYKIEPCFKRLAIFPNEICLYSFKVDESQTADTHYYPCLDEIRDTLVTAGFDGIYLQEEGTFSALQPEAYIIQACYDPLPIFERDVLPKLRAEFGDKLANGVARKFGIF